MMARDERTIGRQQVPYYLVEPGNHWALKASLHYSTVDPLNLAGTAPGFAWWSPGLSALTGGLGVPLKATAATGEEPTFYLPITGKVPGDRVVVVQRMKPTYADGGVFNYVMLSHYDVDINHRLHYLYGSLPAASVDSYSGYTNVATSLTCKKPIVTSMETWVHNHGPAASTKMSWTDMPSNALRAHDDAVDYTGWQSTGSSNRLIWWLKTHAAAVGNTTIEWESIAVYVGNQ